MGGKPNKGTKADKRLKTNKKKTKTPEKYNPPTDSPRKLI